MLRFTPFSGFRSARTFVFFNQLVILCRAFPPTVARSFAWFRDSAGDRCDAVFRSDAQKKNADRQEQNMRQIEVEGLLEGKESLHKYPKAPGVNTCILRNAPEFTEQVQHERREHHDKQTEHSGVKKPSRLNKGPHFFLRLAHPRTHPATHTHAHRHTDTQTHTQTTSIYRYTTPKKRS